MTLTKTKIGAIISVATLTGSDMMLYSVSENFSFIGNLFIESPYLFTYSIIPIMLLLFSCLVSYVFVKRCKRFFTNKYILRLLQLADLNRKIQVWCLLAILSFTIVFDIFCILYWG